MVDLRILRQKGISAKSWRDLLEIKDNTTGGENRLASNTPLSDAELKRENLRERIRQRCVHGRDWNFTNWQTYRALDIIWDAPSRQMSPSIISSIIDRYKDSEQVKEVLTAYGFNLDDLFIETDQIDPKTRLPIKKLSIPAFFNVIVPLVRPYLNIRRAKLVNDRNLHPFHFFKSLIHSKENRVKVAVLNSRVDAMSKQYNYFEALNQSVFQMLLYGHCLKFTQEEWHFEEQERVTGEETTTVEADPEIKNSLGLIPGEGTEEYKEELEESREQVTEKKYKTEKYCVREGLRYHHPHPSRVFWDFSHPMKTFNTDTGASFAGYWKVMRFGELAHNPDFFNTERVSIGDVSWWSAHSTFFNEVYGSAVINVPAIPNPPEDVRQEDREAWLSEHSFYGSDMMDKSIVIFEYREKLIPSEWGLGDYDYPIWTRFVVAGDGTIIYAAPLGYVPVTAYKDNGDEKRRDDASLALQLAPFQDQLSNLLAQYIYAAKQNLTNLTMIDTNVVQPGILTKLKNLGERLFRGVNIIEFDSRKMNKMLLGGGVPQAFYSHRFPPLDTNAILQAMKVVIDLAERVLQFSSQEIAQAATHEQTKAEIETIAATTTNVLQYTGTAVDQGMEADAIQIYQALTNYGEDEFLVQIPADHGLTETQLADIGITMDAEFKQDGQLIAVTAKKTALQLITFAEPAEARNRVTDFEAAQGMATFVRDLLANPMTQAAIGPDQAIALANQIAKLAGVPLEDELRNMTEETKQAEAQNLLKQVIDQVMGQVKEGMVPLMTRIKDVTSKVDALYKALNLPIPSGNGQNGGQAVPIVNGPQTRQSAGAGAGGGGAAEVAVPPAGPAPQAPAIIA